VFFSVWHSFLFISTRHFYTTPPNICVSVKQRLHLSGIGHQPVARGQHAAREKCCFARRGLKRQNVPWTADIERRSNFENLWILARFQAFATTVVIHYRRFGITCWSNLQESSPMTLEDGTDRLSRNVCNELLLLLAA
jgi:hypothetical protein